MRGILEVTVDSSRQPVYYTVIDGDHNKTVLITRQKHVAEFYVNLVNCCEHPEPYDIVWHDKHFLITKGKPGE